METETGPRTNVLTEIVEDETIRQCIVRQGGISGPICKCALRKWRMTPLFGDCQLVYSLAILSRTARERTVEPDSSSTSEMSTCIMENIMLGLRRCKGISKDDFENPPHRKLAPTRRELFIIAANINIRKFYRVG